MVCVVARSSGVRVAAMRAIAVAASLPYHCVQRVRAHAGRLAPASGSAGLLREILRSTALTRPLSAASFLLRLMRATDSFTAAWAGVSSSSSCAAPKRSALITIRRFGGNGFCRCFAITASSWPRWRMTVSTSIRANFTSATAPANGACDSASSRVRLDPSISVNRSSAWARAEGGCELIPCSCQYYARNATVAHPRQDG